MLKEKFKFFKKRPAVKGEFRKLWDTLNTVNEADEVSKNFHQLVKLSATRWLSRYNAVKVLAENYFELQNFF